MKYKKLLLFVTVLFFITVSTICFSALFKVVDVSVDATVVSNSNEQILEKTELVLNEYNGKNLVFCIIINDMKLSEHVKKIFKS